MVALGHLLRSQQAGEANNPRHGYLWIKRLDATWPLLQCCQKLQVASLKLKMQKKSSTFPSNQRKLNLFCPKKWMNGTSWSWILPHELEILQHQCIVSVANRAALHIGNSTATALNRMRLYGWIGPRQKIRYTVIIPNQCFPLPVPIYSSSIPSGSWT